MSQLIKSTEQAEITLVDQGLKVQKTFKDQKLLQKEIKYASQLNCALPFDQGKDSLTYPFCETLDSRLNVLCSPEIANEYINQIIEILRELNNKNIVHRDLKASNLYFHDGVIKVADFETVLEDDDTKTCGTPGIMAPEQYSKVKVDWLADQYAAGIVCFRILTGSLPFQGESSEDYFKLQEKSSPDPASFNVKLKKPLCNFVKKMIEPSPDKRYQSPEDIKLAFDVACAMKDLQPVLEAKSVKISSRENNRKEVQKTDKRKIITSLIIIAVTLYLLTRLGSL